uniref:Uncharacterized protein n=1 Tax=Anguilla anguilla TaxID=7936 RepID=A0A0E9VA77_ANGAN
MLKLSHNKIPGTLKHNCIFYAN